MSVSAASLKVGDSKEQLLVDDLTRTQIVMYAGASGDYNPLHSDERFAREPPNLDRANRPHTDVEQTARLSEERRVIDIAGGIAKKACDKTRVFTLAIPRNEARGEIGVAPGGDEAENCGKAGGGEEGAERLRREQTRQQKLDQEAGGRKRRQAKNFTPDTDRLPDWMRIECQVPFRDVRHG